MNGVDSVYTFYRLTATMRSAHVFIDDVELSGDVEVATECQVDGRAACYCRLVGEKAWYRFDGGTGNLSSPADLPFYHAALLHALELGDGRYESCGSEVEQSGGAGDIEGAPNSM